MAPADDGPRAEHSRNQLNRWRARLLTALAVALGLQFTGRQIWLMRIAGREIKEPGAIYRGFDSLNCAPSRFTGFLVALTVL
jgi:hypothetical protein